jgi:hypothetical protein
MIKAIRLIIEPVQAWSEIALDRKSIGAVFILYLAPLLILSVGGEVAGMYHWGRLDELGQPVKLAPRLLMIYGAAQFALGLAVTFIGAKLVKAMAATFHGRNTYEQCFRLVAYASSPLYLVRLLDAYPRLDLWVCFGIGMVLCMATLYEGVPRLLDPDPPHTFGLYLSSVIMLTFVAGLARLLTWLLLTKKIAM